MGVYIPRIERPKSCDLCSDPYHALPCGLWTETEDGERHPDCPLVEVAEPHGRLIDADAMFKDICDYINSMTDFGIFVNDEMLWGKLNHAIEHAPTVIEAEGVT